MLEIYGDWRPTGFDSPGRYMNPERADWLVAPVMQTRDSNCLAESNFAVLSQELDELDPEQVDHETHRFGHWGPGWLEIILVRPGSACAQAAENAANALVNYPVLCEMDWSEREYERASDYWQRCGLRKRIAWCARYDVSIFAARRDEIPSDPRGELISGLAE